jgi:lipopolysaccharide/colanic/teichoic acid biosynthesis glycosyltransferase
MISGNVSNVFKSVEERVEIDSSYPNSLIVVPREIISPGLLFFKKVMDVVGAAIGIVLSLPIVIVLIALIKLTTHGPVLYTQERIGLFGKSFRIYKFRSMYRSAEEDGPRLSSKNDIRITPIGRFMRCWRLDEIPNMINVFKGEMSLVGPRPERKHYIDQIVQKTPEFTRLLLVKPGVTSLGEVKFGYAENVDEMITRMRFDLYYIDNISILNDLYIISRTINVVLKGKGV